MSAMDSSARASSAPRARDWPWPCTAATLMLVLLIGARVVELLNLPLPKCLFKRMTGVPCMTCGTTRVITALSHFDLTMALRLNPLAACVSLAALLTPLVYACRRRLRLDDDALVPPRLKRPLVITFCALALVNWAYLIRSGMC